MVWRRKFCLIAEAWKAEAIKQKLSSEDYYYVYALRKRPTIVFIFAFQVEEKSV